MAHRLFLFGIHLHWVDHTLDHPMSRAMEFVRYQFDGFHLHSYIHCKIKISISKSNIFVSEAKTIFLVKFNENAYFWRRANTDRSPDLESSSSVLFEFLLLDILRRPPIVASSFFGVVAVLRLISVFDDCVEPFFWEKIKIFIFQIENFNKFFNKIFEKNFSFLKISNCTWNTTFACKRG